MTTKTFARIRDRYLISSDPTLLSLSDINAAFASSAMYWCTPLPTHALRKCLDNSFCLGLYINVAASPMPPGLGTAPKPEQIGLARMITDYTTFAYLTDVYIIEEEQGKGLGNWLIECVDEVLKEMGHLRAAMLVAGNEKGEEYYKNKLGMKRVEQGENGYVTMHRRGPEADGSSKSH